MGLLDWLWGRNGADPSAADDARVEQAIETAVRGTDPRLRLVSGYRERLEPAVRTALAYCGQLIRALPDSLDASPAAWSGSAAMRAFLARADDLRGVLARSPEVREFLFKPKYAGAESVFAVLTMAREQRTVLGSALIGETLHRDVAQRTVSFSEHRVAAPRASEEQLRAELESRAFEHLIIEALANIGAERALDCVPDDPRGLLETRMRLMRDARGGLDALFIGPQESQAKFRLLREELVETERQLDARCNTPGMFNHYLERVIAVLANPDRVVTLGHVSLWLDAMNVVCRPEDAGAAEVHISEITSRTPEPSTRTVALIHFPRSTVPPGGLAWDEAARLLA